MAMRPAFQRKGYRFDVLETHRGTCLGVRPTAVLVLTPVLRPTISAICTRGEPQGMIRGGFLLLLFWGWAGWPGRPAAERT